MSVRSQENITSPWCKNKVICFLNCWKVSHNEAFLARRDGPARAKQWSLQEHRWEARMRRRSASAEWSVGVDLYGTSNSLRYSVGLGRWGWAWATGSRWISCKTWGWHVHIYNFGWLLWQQCSVSVGSWWLWQAGQITVNYSNLLCWWWRHGPVSL